MTDPIVTSVRSRAPSAEMFARIASIANLSCSTKRHEVAPRDRASSPSAPDVARYRDRQAIDLDRLLAAGLDRHPRRRADPSEAQQAVERNRGGTGAVRRIEQDQVERRPGRRQGQHRLGTHVAARLRMEVGDIGPQRAQGRRILLNEQARVRAA